MTLRGATLIYNGDEQGFAGSGRDQDAREDMFASKTARYNTERLVGTSATTAQSSCGTEQPLFKSERQQIVRADGSEPVLFAVSRLDADRHGEILIAFNTSLQPVDAQVDIDPYSQVCRTLHDSCAPQEVAGSYRGRLAALDYVICASAPP